MTTATMVAQNDRRAAELRGRAIGVSILAFFALAWLGWGTGGHLPTTPQVTLMVAAAAVSIALAGYAWAIYRRAPHTADGPQHDHGNINRRFGIIVGIEWVGIGVVCGSLGALGYANAIPAATALGVGVHFFPLAKLFGVRPYYATGILVCLIAVVTFVLAPATSTTQIWTLLPGIGISIVLYATCVVLLRWSSRLGAGPDAC